MKFEIIVGSMLGASEYVAEDLATALQEKNHQTTVHLQPDFDQLDQNSIWLICTSTHGAGELPDNIQPFAAQLAEKDLSGLNFLTIALGDTSYDTFCAAGKTLHQKLSQAGARPLSDVFCIDVLEHPVPEEAAVEWLNQWMAQSSIH